MTGGLPEGMDRAPEPVRRLATSLANRRLFLVSMPMKDAQRGDRLYYARTPLGQVRVWSNRGAWVVELQPPGMTAFVDAGVWQACRSGTELGLARPPLEEQVAWLEGLLAGRTLPAHDAACLAAGAEQRAKQPNALTGARLWIVLAIALPVFGAAAWAAAAYDLPGVRIAVSVAVAGLLVALLKPYAARWRARRGRD